MEEFETRITTAKGELFGAFRAIDARRRVIVSRDRISYEEKGKGSAVLPRGTCFALTTSTVEGRPKRTILDDGLVQAWRQAHHVRDANLHKAGVIVESAEPALQHKKQSHEQIASVYQGLANALLLRLQAIEEVIVRAEQWCLPGASTIDPAMLVRDLEVIWERPYVERAMALAGAIRESGASTPGALVEVRSLRLIHMLSMDLLSPVAFALTEADEESKGVDTCWARVAEGRKAVIHLLKQGTFHRDREIRDALAAQPPIIKAKQAKVLKHTTEQVIRFLAG